MKTFSLHKYQTAILFNHYIIIYTVYKIPTRQYKNTSIKKPTLERAGLYLLTHLKNGIEIPAMDIFTSNVFQMLRLNYVQSFVQNDLQFDDAQPYELILHS